MLFENAYCDVTWTTASMASTLTGTYATRHGLRSNFNRLSEANTTVAEVLKRDGYQTFAVIGSYPLDSIFQLDQGFDVYDDRFTLPIVQHSDDHYAHVESRIAATNEEQNWLNMFKLASDSRRTDEQVTDAAIQLLRGRFDGRKPLFMWVHYFGPHDLPSAKLDLFQNDQQQVKTYGGNVVTADSAVGRLLAIFDTIVDPKSTLVILHADHGEALGEHDFVGHGRYLYEDNLRIPLIMRWPGRLPAGTRVMALARNVDIAATVLDAAGVDATKLELDGQSLLSVVKAPSTSATTMYIETYMPSQYMFAEPVRTGAREVRLGAVRFGVLAPPWKYVATIPHPRLDAPEPQVPAALRESLRREELYNLMRDPKEANNLIGSSEGRPVAEELRALVDRYRAESVTGGGKSEAVHPSEEHLRKLRSLGYVN